MKEAQAFFSMKPYNIILNSLIKLANMDFGEGTENEGKNSRFLADNLIVDYSSGRSFFTGGLWDAFLD